MRTYIQDHSTFYLLDSIESFGYGLFGKDSRISLTHIGDTASRNKVLLYNLDEDTAVRALQELLGLTTDSDDRGVAVISWDGKHFTRQIL